MISGFEARSSAVPVAPTAVDRMNPIWERSIKYQSTGLTRESVRDACMVEVHGTRLCSQVSTNVSNV